MEDDNYSVDVEGVLVMKPAHEKAGPYGFPDGSPPFRNPWLSDPPWCLSNPISPDRSHLPLVFISTGSSVGGMSEPMGPN